MDTVVSKLRLMISLHFDKIINEIDILTETLIGDSNLDESIKTKICKIREKFISIIKNIETSNLNAITNANLSCYSNVFQLEKLLINDSFFESNELIAILLKENCLFIEYKYLNDNQKEHPLGILVICDWYLDEKKLQNFKCSREIFNEKKSISDSFLSAKSEELWTISGNFNLNKDVLIEKRIIFELSTKLNEANEDVISMKLIETQELDLRHMFFEKIEMGVFSFVSQLKTLNLSENYLKNEVLIAEIFEPLKNLKSLNISGNEFTEIPEFLFQYLCNLENLELQMNCLSIVHSNSFCGLSKLSYLNLSANKLVELEPRVFGMLKSLKKLCLDNQNKLTSGERFLRISGIFENLNELEYLEIGYNNFENKINNSEAFFKGLDGIKYLDLTNSCFNEFDEFEELKNLEDLNISLCELKVFEYRCSQSLRILNLSSNNLEFLNENSFRNLSNLEKLCLAQNKLNTLVNGCFSSLLSLKSLDLQSNKLHFLKANIFLDLKSLEELFLNDNKIDSIDENCFDMLFNLRELNLSNNSIVYFEKKTFDNLKSLEKLDLSQNKLKSLNETVFDKLGRMKFLFLNKNLLHSIEKNLFRNTSFLEILNLNQNFITFFNNSTFDHCTKLKKLFIGGNELNLINKDLFKNLIELEELCIYHNKIQYIEDFSFRNLNKLVSLKLHDNLIKHLTRHTFVGLVNLKELLKYNNPINYIERGTFNFNKKKIL